MSRIRPWWTWFAGQHVCSCGRPGWAGGRAGRTPGWKRLKRPESTDTTAVLRIRGSQSTAHRESGRVGGKNSAAELLGSRLGSADSAAKLLRTRAGRKKSTAEQVRTRLGSLKSTTAQVRTRSGSLKSAAAQVFGGFPGAGSAARRVRARAGAWAGRPNLAGRGLALCERGVRRVRGERGSQRGGCDDVLKKMLAGFSSRLRTGRHDVLKDGER